VSQARQLDPLWLINRYIHCHVLIAARQFERAAGEMEDLLELNPNLPGTYWYLSMALGGQGKVDQAIPVLEKGVELVHGIPLYVGHLALLYAHAGRRAEAAAILQQMLEQPACPPFLIAILYGALGDRDRAFVYLEKAVERHNESISLMGVDWRFDSLRGDPRFTKVLKRVGLAA
jgi:tetratricopeptide (TPR) repeat protein